METASASGSPPTSTTLNRTRRCAAGIQKLANETLSSIFQILEECNSPSSYLKRNSWIFSTTHTCQRWRNVALANPLLWTRIKHFNSIDLMNSLIERTQGLKITILLQPPLHLLTEHGRLKPQFSLTSNGKALRLVLERCSDHIERLDVEIIEQDNETWSVVNTFLEKSLLRLEFLSISLLETLGARERVLPAFLHNLPSLKELSFSNISYRWSTSFRKLTGLTTLRLDGVVIQPTMRHLLDLLGGCHELRDLTLIDMNFDPEFDTPSEDHVVLLPQLQALCIQDFYYDECVELLDHLQINQAIIWQISCEDYGGDGSLSLNLGSCVFKHMEPIIQIEVSLVAHALVIVGCGLKDGIMKHISRLELKDYGSRIMSLDFTLNLFKNIIQNSAWSKTQEIILHLTTNRTDDEHLKDYNHANWSFLLKIMQHVVSLTVVHSEVYTYWEADRDFAQALFDPIPEYRFPDSDSYWELNDFVRTHSISPGLNNLKHLTLEQFDFTEDKAVGKDFCTQLADALYSRDRLGYQLESLDISTCRGVSEQQIRFLSHYVKNIKVEYDMT